MPMCPINIKRNRFRIFLREIENRLSDLDANINFKRASDTCIVSLVNPKFEYTEKSKEIIIIKTEIPGFRLQIPRRITFLEPIEHPYVDGEGNLDLSYFSEIWNSISEKSWAQKLILVLRKVICASERDYMIEEEEKDN